jgi:predicted DNA-binding ribbon-helix-helix protein
MAAKGKHYAPETRGRRKSSNSEAKGTSTLINRNVSLGGRRTSFRLEQGMWDALDEICHREAIGLGALFERLDQRRRESSLTAAIRVYILSYYRAAATEVGHAAAGHGRLRGGTKAGTGPAEG